MSDRWTKTERASWIFTIIAGLIAIIGIPTAVAWLMPTNVPVNKVNPTGTTSKQPVTTKVQVTAQTMRSAAMSFRTLAAERVIQPNVSWQSAELDFRAGDQFYEKEDYAQAIMLFEKAERAFNNIYAAANGQEGPLPVARNTALTAPVQELKVGEMGHQTNKAAHLEAYVKKLDAEIREKEEEVRRAAPLEAGAPNNSAMNSIEEEIRTLRSLRTEAKRKIIEAI